MLLVGVLLAGAGCRYERVVKYKPFFAGMEGAETDTPAVIDEDLREAYARPTGPIEVENEDGSITLISRSVADLMRHIARTLANNEQELFVEQVLSERSRERLLRAGRQPEEAFEELKANQEAVAKLFTYLPMGEYSPNGVFKKVGDKTYLLRATGPGTRDLYWTGFDAVQEGGMWKLGWFYR